MSLKINLFLLGPSEVKKADGSFGEYRYRIIIYH